MKTRSQGARRRGEPLELHVDDVAMTGEGVAHLPNGDAVFVPGTIAGERILADVGDGRPRRGRLVRMLVASEERVAPACPEVQRCGGCDFMHLTVAARETWHRRHALRALEGPLGKLGIAVPEPTFHAAPRDLGYRTRARLHVVANGRQVKVGYRGARSHEVVAVKTCVVLDQALERCVPELSELLAGSRGEGEAMIARGAGGTPVFDLRFSGRLGDGVFAAVDAAVRSGRLVGARLRLDGASEPLVFGDPRPVVRAADDRDLVMAAGGFAQASDDAAAALARHVAELARSAKPEKAIELFAGSGTFTVVLAPEVGQLTAIERDEQAVVAMRDNLRARGLAVKVRAEDAENLVLPKVDLIVLDPPRGGAPGAVAAIVKARPKRIVYVSCNALTLARDLAALAADRYRLESLDLFDVFPQTSHVEVVAALAR